MKLGVIARAEDRGLGILTWEVVRHLEPERVLLIDMGELDRGFPQHRDRYPGATLVPWVDGQLPERLVRGWLEGLDVVYSAETFYDPRVVGWATLAGCATVLHVMPEFVKPDQPRPTRVWVPTPWRRDLLLPNELVPIPVATDRWSDKGQRNIPDFIPGEPLRVLHVGGHKTTADRNGTLAFVRALSLVHERIEARITDQDAREWGRRPVGQGVTLKVEGWVGNYWDLYGDAELLVMPRRYGGLCLPVQEAAGAGLAVALPNISPNEWYPAALFRSQLGGRLETPAGRIAIGTANATHVARTLDLFARDRDHLHRYQERARSWADEHSWTSLRPYWLSQLEKAAG